MAEFLMCVDLGWTWQECVETPQPVMDHFKVYRAARAKVLNWQSQPKRPSKFG